MFINEVKHNSYDINIGLLLDILRFSFDSNIKIVDGELAFQPKA